MIGLGCATVTRRAQLEAAGLSGLMDAIRVVSVALHCNSKAMPASPQQGHAPRPSEPPWPRLGQCC
jgi:hypothetical protein